MFLKINKVLVYVHRILIELRGLLIMVSKQDIKQDVTFIQITKYNRQRETCF